SFSNPRIAKKGGNIIRFVEAKAYIVLNNKKRPYHLGVGICWNAPVVGISHSDGCQTVADDQRAITSGRRQAQNRETQREIKRGAM
ncbi:hypothetical protein B0H12DRAFT_1099242, partial [Mycena haematopus]